MPRSPTWAMCIICFEDISELARDSTRGRVACGMARRNRAGIRTFASGGWFVPDSIRGSETEGTYHGILRSLAEIYRLLHQPVTQFISERERRAPKSMKPADYQRTIAARTFDVTRYLLPLRPGRTSGQVVSIRTLEKQITRLLSSQLPELRAIGDELKDACQRSPCEPLGRAMWPASRST